MWPPVCGTKHLTLWNVFFGLWLESRRKVVNDGERQIFSSLAYVAYTFSCQLLTPKGVGGGGSHIKVTAVIVGKFLGTPKECQTSVMWAWLE